MHDDDKLREVLSKAPLLRLSFVTLTRFVFERHRRTAGAPVGVARLGGRYNPARMPVLYTSFERSTALDEFVQMFDDSDPIAVASMVTLLFLGTRVLDLTDPGLLSQLDLTKEDVTGLRIPNRPIQTQRIGPIASSLEMEASSYGARNGRSRRIWSFSKWIRLAT